MVVKEGVLYANCSVASPGRDEIPRVTIPTQSSPYVEEDGDEDEALWWEEEEKEAGKCGQEGIRQFNIKLLSVIQLQQ